MCVGWAGLVAGLSIICGCGTTLVKGYHNHDNDGSNQHIPLDTLNSTQPQDIFGGGGVVVRGWTTCVGCPKTNKKCSEHNFTFLGYILHAFFPSPPLPFNGGLVLKLLITCSCVHKLWIINNFLSALASKQGGHLMWWFIQPWTPLDVMIHSTMEATWCDDAFNQSPLDVMMHSTMEATWYDDACNHGGHLMWWCIQP